MNTPAEKFPNVRRLMTVAGLVSAMGGRDSYGNDLDSYLFESFMNGGFDSKEEKDGDDE